MNFNHNIFVKFMLSFSSKIFSILNSSFNFKIKFSLYLFITINVNSFAKL